MGDITIEAERPHFERGAMRATLTVRNHTAIFFRDTANLTSVTVRERILKQLIEKKVSLEENVIIALDEACRTSRPSANTLSKKMCDGGGDFSEKVVEYRVLQGKFTSWLLLKDPDVLVIDLAVVKGHELGGNPVWLLNVAPLLGTKTEIISSLDDVLGMYPLSELTARSFASGLDTHGGGPSLLSQLKEEILALKALLVSTKS